jgi:hypothetical protein
MSNWPTSVSEAALHGPAGEFVRLVEPHTEADPIALLIEILVSFGVAAGRHAHLRVEASHHYPNEFCVLVGASAKGRKGSSWDHVETLLTASDPDFTADRLASGLSSGEGLIAEVRDPLDDTDTTAPADKRLLVLEPEFAQVMKVLAREGNTLSPVIRNSWDGKRLQALVRNAPLRATSAHVGIVAHITQGRAPALPQRDRARQRLLQPLPARRRQAQQAAAVRRHPHRPAPRPAQAQARRRARTRPHLSPADLRQRCARALQQHLRAALRTPAGHVRRRDRTR